MENLLVKVSRNAPCPCESGLKYKNCCGLDKPAKPAASALAGLVPSRRMKGGIRNNPDREGFIAIVHTWDNVEGRGAPDEWRDSQVFSTEEEAMHHYKTTIRPALDQVMAEIGTRGIKTFQRRLE